MEVGELVEITLEIARSGGSVKKGRNKKEEIIFFSCSEVPGSSFLYMLITGE